jgi:hypothetical protein
MMPDPTRVTGAFTAATVADASAERDVVEMLMQRAGFDVDSFQVTGKGKLVEFSAVGDDAPVQRIREMLSGRAFRYPGLWTRVESVR